MLAFVGILFIVDFATEGQFNPSSKNRPMIASAVEKVQVTRLGCGAGGAAAAQKKKIDWSSVPCPHSTEEWQRCDLSDDRWGVPTLLISFGRSGSTVTWDTIAALATGDNGTYQSSTEDMGSGSKAALRFFETIDPTEHGKCAVQRVLCARQRENRLAMESYEINGGLDGSAVYGTKLKPYLESFGHKKSREALHWLGSQSDVKVIYLQRNLLDVYLSKYKHSATGLPAHCHKGNTECIQRHQEALKSLVVPTDTLIEELEHWEHAKNQTIALLETYNVDLVHLQYENLYYGENADEWNKALQHLGKAPARPLTRDDVMAHIEHVATTPASHAEKMANYDEVKAVLENTRYMKYLQ